MNYELFEKAAAINSQFEIIPSKTSILAKGIVIDNNGYMNYKGKTYLTNMVKIIDLPTELQSLFVEKKLPVKESQQEIIEVKEEKKDKLDNLNNILFEQLQNIVDPEDGVDISQELKKANAVCNVADKIISIADLSLKAEMFSHKKRHGSGRSLYQD